MAPGDRLDDGSSAAGVLQDVPPLTESAVLTKFVIVQYQVLMANLSLSYYPPKPSYVVFQAWSKTNS